MKAKPYSIQETSLWQRIFLQSKVNGASYHEEQPLGGNWSWPKDTYLQSRLQYLRKSSDELVNLSRYAGSFTEE
jgi:hypothetical protein